VLDEVDNELQTTEIKDYISDNILLIFFVFVSTRAVLQLFSCLNMMHVFEHFVPFYHRKNVSVCTLSLWVQVLDSDWSTALATTLSNINHLYTYILHMCIFLLQICKIHVLIQICILYTFYEVCSIILFKENPSGNEIGGKYTEPISLFSVPSKSSGIFCDCS